MLEKKLKRFLLDINSNNEKLTKLKNEILLKD